MRIAVVLLPVLAACMAVPDGAEMLEGSALSDRISGQRLVLPPPEGENFLPPDVQMVADFKADGTAELGIFDPDGTLRGPAQSERWSVAGRQICVFRSATPRPSDCIQVDWVAGNQLQVNETLPDGSSRTGIGTLSPL